VGRETIARRLAAGLFIVSATPACGLVVGGDAGQCSRDEDCPAIDMPLVCIDGLCLAGEADETSSTSGADDPCGAAAECVPTAPPGWYGPVIAIATETAPAACPSSAPMAVTIGHAGLIADEATCACDCDATNVGCDVTVFGSVGKCTEDFATNLMEDTCATIPLGLLPPSGQAVFPAMFDGCIPLAEEEVPPLQWSEHVQTCEASPVACGDGTCMPIPDPLTGASTCIWDDGERDCPEADYTSKFVFHRGVTDTRDCVPCSCGEPSSCRISIYESSMCMDEPAFETLLDEPQCIPFADIIPAPMAAVGLVVSAITPSMGACVPTGGTATGAATEVDTFTVCCRQ
jgi:hypothetical protein